MKRQLVGPTIVTLILTALVLDYLFLSQSPWSVVNVLVKILSVFAAIGGAFFDPKNLAWLDDFLLPVTMMALAALLLVLTIARAKRAMRRVTSEADEPAQLAERSQLTDISQAFESLTGPEVPVRESRSYPLIRKLTYGFGAVGLLFSIAACLIVSSYLSRAYEKELVHRAQVTTLGLTELVKKRVAANAIKEIGNDVDKYGAIKAVAYIYVEDAKGAMIAHSPKDLPRYLKRDFPKSAERALTGVDVDYRGTAVFEVSNRLSGPNVSFVHLAIWRDVIGVEARIALLPIAASIVVILLGVVGMFVVIARRLNRPLLELVDQTDRISRGDFSVALSVKRSDEIGEIARSVERLRSSLHAVVRRLADDKSNLAPGRVPARSDR